MSYGTAEHIRELIQGSGRRCLMVNDRFTGAKRPGYLDAWEIPRDAECLVILGGDGTMIRAARDFCDMRIPLLGVNLGTLGFLTEVERQNIEESLDEIFKGSYKIERRMMLEGRSGAGGQETYLGKAFNDFVISKITDGRLITLHVYVNGELMDTYVGDGLIISSPTGSTGYNLSAGGPVLTPDVRAMIITPICPHSLNKRSLVISSDDAITVEIGKTKEFSDDFGVVSVDGSNRIELTTGDRVRIGRYREDIQIVKLARKSFYDRLRAKLNRGM